LLDARFRGHDVNRSFLSELKAAEASADESNRISVVKAQHGPSTMVVPGWKRRAKTVTGVADSTESSYATGDVLENPFAKAPNAGRYAQIPEIRNTVWLTTHDLGALGKSCVLRRLQKQQNPARRAWQGFASISV
jgi:hypothetical protein